MFNYGLSGKLVVQKGAKGTRRESDCISLEIIILIGNSQMGLGIRQRNLKNSFLVIGHVKKKKRDL